MGPQAKRLFAGPIVAPALGAPPGAALAQSDLAAELMLNNSIIHPDDPPPPEVRYSFSARDLETLAGQDGVGVIVHHGERPDLSGFAAAYSHTERLDFFTPQRVDPAHVSRALARAILAGDVTNWAEVGGADRKITIYQPASPLKKAAIRAQLLRAGVGLRAEVEERAGYVDLAKALADDPGAFVMGLRSEAAWDENLPDARRLAPADADGRPAFAMPIQIYVRAGDPGAAAAARVLLSMVSVRAGQDRMAFSASGKLQDLALAYPPDRGPEAKRRPCRRRRSSPKDASAAPAARPP